MIKQLSKFFQDFVDKACVFDPMNRPILTDGNDQAIKCEELVNILEGQMVDKAVRGYMLQAPISEEMNDSLNKDIKLRKYKSDN